MCHEAAENWSRDPAPCNDGGTPYENHAAGCDRSEDDGFGVKRSGGMRRRLTIAIRMWPPSVA
jgi:hypothetical protein